MRTEWNILYSSSSSRGDEWHCYYGRGRREEGEWGAQKEAWPVWVLVLARHLFFDLISVISPCWCVLTCTWYIRVVRGEMSNGYLFVLLFDAERRGRNVNSKGVYVLNLRRFWHISPSATRGIKALVSYVDALVCVVAAAFFTHLLSCLFFCCRCCCMIQTAWLAGKQVCQIALSNAQKVFCRH